MSSWSEDGSYGGQKEQQLFFYRLKNTGRNNVNCTKIINIVISSYNLKGFERIMTYDTWHMSQKNVTRAYMHTVLLRDNVN